MFVLKDEDCVKSFCAKKEFLSIGFMLYIAFFVISSIGAMSEQEGRLIGKMKLIYKGKYNGDPSTLPHGEHMPNAVKFKELEGRKFAVVMNVISIAVTILFVMLIYVRTEVRNLELIGIGGGIMCLTFVPHELLHAIFLREEYTYIML